MIRSRRTVLGAFLALNALLPPGEAPAPQPIRPGGPLHPLIRGSPPRSRS